jgi:hypothetical protein
MFHKFKININLVIIIILFVILCISYILIIPVFETPDEPGHFLYVFYISKYNSIPSQYNETISTNRYIEENIDENADKTFYMDEKYMFYGMPSSSPSGRSRYYHDQRHQPPLYYLISSQIIKPFGVDNIYADINYENYNNPNRFENNSILEYGNSTIFLVLILRLFQVIYGILIIIFIYRILKLLTDDKFVDKSIFLISGIAFLPQFLFLCSYVNNDVLSALFGLVSVYFIILLFKRNKAYFGLISILFSIIASFTKPTILIMVPLTVVTLTVWGIIMRKKWGVLSIIAILILFSVGLYLIMSFGKTGYKEKRVEVEWDESNINKNEEAESIVLVENYGLSFDGEGNMISVSSIPSSAVKELTVEAWVFLNGFDRDVRNKTMPIVSDWNSWSPDNQKGYLLRVVYNAESDELVWNFIICYGDGYKELTYCSLSYEEFSAKYFNRWLHVSGVFKGSEYIKFLINGEVKETLSTGVPEKMEPDIDTPTWFGYSGINPGYINGIIDEVRIWDVARSENEIRSNMYQELTGDEDGLIGYWNFKEGRFSTVYDITQNKNHGTIIYEATGYSSPLLNRILVVGSGVINKFKDGFKEGLVNSREALPETFQSSTAVFGWMNIFADKFIYNFFLAYIFSGILLFFINIKEYIKSKKSIIFIIASIISIFIYFLLYGIYGDWAQQQGRIILLAIFLTYILAIMGYGTIKIKMKNILYYILFGSSIFLSIFCLYNYIYINYY